jgi:uncharacterized protein YoxC
VLDKDKDAEAECENKAILEQIKISGEDVDRKFEEITKKILESVKEQTTAVDNVLRRQEHFNHKITAIEEKFDSTMKTIAELKEFILKK